MRSLQGLKVVDLTRALSGPFCSMVLADLGADVIKVEAGPNGDMSRVWGPFDRGVSTYYLSCNRNKRGICVDFRSSRGLDVVRRLIDDADVVVENFKPGTAKDMGLDFESLRVRNPQLVMGSINAFGTDGPLREWPGFDQIAQGYSGMMSLTGFPDSDPTRTGTAIGDLSSGMWLSIAIVSALYERERTGQGQHVTTSLLAGLVGLLSVHGQRYLSVGQVPQRTGNAHSVIAPYGVFQTADGPLNLAPITTDMWNKLCRLLDLPNLPSDPLFLTNEDRVTNRDLLRTVLETRLKDKGKREWTELLVSAGVPAGPIHTLDEVFADAQVQHAELVESVAHRQLGAIRQVPTPIFTNEPGTTSDSRDATRYAPPELGEHTFSVLLEAGFSPEELETLVQDKVLFQASATEKDTASTEELMQ
ncbi:CoA transferase [Caballeronia sp. LZ001]|uniref:CaiB/BaiF CoA transferase family protein n=1 Tax=Caballeronia sp. LZ001 TaxID=3038553 RepID=UPI0028583503|nr:CoA transferase [Caballeronia sp. LZ001]MDR5804777.1 CoA transferase [Caballeronia sp. LZ001]